MQPARPRSPILLACTLLAVSSFGQDAAIRTNDRQAWATFALQYAPTKRWTLGAQYAVRNFGAYQDFKGSYYYLKARRKLDKHWYSDAQLRYVNTYRRDFFRVETGLTYRERWHKNKVLVRSAFFNERRQFSWASDHYRQPTNFWRNRIKYQRDLPARFTAYTSAEVWTQLSNEGPVIRRTAFMAGFDRTFRKKGKWGLDYLYQPEYNTRRSKQLFALNARVEWDLTKRKKKPGKNKTEAADDDL